MVKVNWNKVTEVSPPEGRNLLVWTGKSMIVSEAHYYDEHTRREYAALAADALSPWFSEKDRKHMINCTGRFMEFGASYCFDDPDVCWAELPLEPGKEHIDLVPLEDPWAGMISKDAYLTKEGTIIGIHAFGEPGPYEWIEVALDGTETKKQSNFMQAEIWGNEYDEEHNMLGRGSFRVHGQFEIVVKEFEADGWIQREAPKKKE